MTRKPTPGKPKQVKGSYDGQDMAERKRVEEALRNAEARYRVLFEQSPNAIVLIDVETGKTIEANEIACKQLGYTREEFAVLGISDYEARETPEETQEHIQKVRSRGSDDFETLQRTRNGEIRNVHVWARTVLLGERKAFYCIFQDITERRQAENALRESEKSLREAQAIAGLGSYVTDISTGLWKSSDELDRIFGIDDRYVRSVEGWLALVHPEWRALMNAYLTNDVLGKRIRFDKEYKIVRKNDNEERWLHGLGELEFDDRGQPVKMRGTIQDITERKLADESRQVQSAALNAAANAIVITDRSGAIEWVNRAFTALTGYAAVDVLGKNPRLLKSGKHDLAFYQSLWKTVLSGQTWRAETTDRRKDGSLYTEYQTITPVLDESGAITHFVAIKEDIAERLRLQAQLLQAQKMESVGRLAGGVAHDFNNLLSVIIGWTGLALQDLPAGHAVRPSLEEVLKAGEGAADLTQQLLAFSRQQVVEPTLFSVNDLVVEMDKMFRRLIGEDIEFVTRTDPELGTVKMDRGQLEQVLMNLVVNARDATPEGGTLTIETANVMLDAEYPRRDADVAPGEYVMVVVSDSGTGMSEEVKTHVFEPFFTTKGPGKGTGLGLATSYGIVKQAGGQIAVYSEEGLGTTMKVYLPRHHEAVERAVRRRRKTPTRGVETILLVEDEPAVRRVTAHMLEAQGYRVLSTSSGEEALRVIEDGREPWHLLLTDVILAEGMSGPELAERVRALRPDLKVLFVSGYTSDVTILHGLLEPSVALVQKPFTGESLGSKVRQVLDAK
jgi:PAS domain S-box-containing protein